MDPFAQIVMWLMKRFAARHPDANFIDTAKEIFTLLDQFIAQVKSANGGVAPRQVESRRA